MLAPDTHTKRHMQWFYFRVSNVEPGVKYKFNLVNLCKSKSLYNNGLRPLSYRWNISLCTLLAWLIFTG